MAKPSGGGLKIDSREALEAWLKGKPRAVAQAIATRAALRVLPLVGDDVPLVGGEAAVMRLAVPLRISWLFGAFRCLLVSWVAANENVTEDTRRAADTAKFYYTRADDAAAMAVLTACADENANNYSASTAFAAAFATNDPISVWHAVEADYRKFDAGKLADEVMRLPIWHGETPDWARQAWREMTENQDLQNPGFAPWFKWYEGIAGLDGGPTRDIFGPELSLKIALQPDDWWKRGPEAVNADIAQWLAEKGEKEAKLAVEIAEIGEKPPQQRPAAYRFAWRGGKLAPLPPDAAQDAADAAVMLDELRRKAVDFAGLLQARHNYDYNPRIARSVDLLLAALPEDLGKVNPGLLRSRGRSIENDAVFFAASDELPEDVKSHLNDVAGSLRDLLVCYPQIREKELAACALDLIGADVNQVLRDLAATRDGAAEAVDVVAAETVEAFDAMAQAPEDPATFVRSDAGRLWLADRVLVAGNYLAELVRGATTIVYDRLAPAETIAGDAWRAVRPKIAEAAVEELEFTKTPNGFFTVANLLAAELIMGIVCLLGYPLLKPMIERAIRHLKTLAEKPPDDG